VYFINIYFTTRRKTNSSDLLLIIASRFIKSKNDGVRGVEHIKDKLLLQAKLSYSPIKSVIVFVNGRNLLDKKSREYYRSDATYMILLGCVRCAVLIKLRCTNVM